MDERPVIFVDSGLGGLPYLYSFHRRNPREKLICVGDRANFPYGVKSRERLITLLDSLFGELLAAWEPKIIALACNTASISALDFLRAKYPLPIVGTVPAVKPAVLASKTRRVGVLGTERTIKDPYIMELARRFGPDCEILREAAPGLVEFAEHRFGDSTREERLETVKPYIEKFRDAGADAIVLGCTHFLLLIEDFRSAAGDDMGVYDSVEGVSRRLESILDDDGGKLKAPSASNPGAPLLVITGGEAPEPYWQKLCRRFGFSFGQVRRGPGSCEE